MLQLLLVICFVMSMKRQSRPPPTCIQPFLPDEGLQRFHVRGQCDVGLVYRELPATSELYALPNVRIAASLRLSARISDSKACVVTLWVQRKRQKMCKERARTAGNGDGVQPCFVRRRGVLLYPVVQQLRSACCIDWVGIPLLMIRPRAKWASLSTPDPSSMAEFKTSLDGVTNQTSANAQIKRSHVESTKEWLNWTGISCWKTAPLTQPVAWQRHCKENCVLPHARPCICVQHAMVRAFARVSTWACRP